MGSEFSKQGKDLLTFSTHLVFVTYDWIINLGDEIDYFWDFRRGRKLTAATLLYVLNRYPPIIYELLSVRSGFRLSDAVNAYIFGVPLQTANWDSGVRTLGP